MTFEIPPHVIFSASDVLQLRVMAVVLTACPECKFSSLQHVYMQWLDAESMQVVVIRLGIID